MSDSVALWLLNGLVRGSRPLSQLVQEPDQVPQSASRAYWLFPDRPALEATAEYRAAKLKECVQQGWVDLYSRDWLQAEHFGSQGRLAIQDTDLTDIGLVADCEAVITLRGHQQWENEFQPDWDRFWEIASEAVVEDSHERLFSVLYASDQILSDLDRWFTAYRGLDQQAGLTVLGCHTSFQYQATQWKVLPYIKVVRWKALDAVSTMNKLLHPSFPTDISNDALEDRKKGLRQHLQDFMQTQEEAAEQASKVLDRLGNL